MTAEKTATGVGAKGVVIQVIGAVVDVQFAKESIPKVYDALRVTSHDTITGLFFVVE